MSKEPVNNKTMDRMYDLIDKISEGLYERKETIAITLLAALAGQSVFLYGLPGTAKSLIARRLGKAFKDSVHFEYLMQRFSTPEDVFGPVSIQELKKDNYLRKTKGYLPTADFAFLDEIWKSSPAILNTLLTVINERIFRNGDKEEKVPLKAIIAASNETPPAGQGLEALYDRFIMRVLVNPLELRENFEKLLGDEPVSEQIEIPEALQFTTSEWQELPSKINKVKISQEVFAIINAIRVSIAEYNQNNPVLSVYVSDRRWQKAALILKTAAYLCGRETVIPVDTLILKHSLWTQEKNREDICKIVDDAVKNFGTVNREEFQRWQENHKDLEKGVQGTFYYNEDIYDAEDINGEKCFAAVIDVKKDYRKTQNVKIYIPMKYIGKKKDFTPHKEDGQLEDKIQCNFKGLKTCSILMDSYLIQNGWNQSYRSEEFVEKWNFNPPIKIKKGTQKEVDHRTKTAFEKDSSESVKVISDLIVQTQNYIADQRKAIKTPFVPKASRELVINALSAYLADLENHKLDAEHLQKKVQSYASTK